MNVPNTSGVVSGSRDVSRFIFGHYQESIWIIISRKSLIMIFQPRNPVAFLPGSDAYMDNWCDIKCRKGPNENWLKIHRVRKHSCHGFRGSPFDPFKSNKTEVREIITYYDCQSTMNRQIFDQFYPNTTIISGTNTRYLKYHIICRISYDKRNIIYLRYRKFVPDIIVVFG